MILDADLQNIAGFTHTQADGSNIGGVPPLVYGAEPCPGKHHSLLLHTSGNSDTTGNGYPAFLWSINPRPILPNTGKLTMRYKVQFGGNLAGMNVFETDTKLVAVCADGKTRMFNLSLQRHNPNGQIDVGDWDDTGIRMEALAIDETVDVEIDYAFDTVKNVCSVLRYIDNISGSHPVPTAYKNMPATLSTWAVGAIPQIQLGSMPSAQPWSAKVWGLDYVWQ